jgi:hypothetical protein
MSPNLPAFGDRFKKSHDPISLIIDLAISDMQRLHI